MGSHLVPSGVSIGMLYGMWVGSHPVPSGVSIGMLYGVGYIWSIHRDVIWGVGELPSGVSIGMLYGVGGLHLEYP